MNEPSLTRAFTLLLRRDLTLAFRHRSELANPLLFFVIVISLFPMGVSPESRVLQMIAHPVSVLVLAKVLAHWLVTGLPLLVLAPLLGVLLFLPIEAMPALVASLALGTPLLSLIGSIGMALTVGLRRSGVLLSLLVLPLYVPVLIFGANAVDAAAAGLPVTGQMYFLGAMLVLALSLSPLATAASLRISVS
jgi:heme exporter protein B